MAPSTQKAFKLQEQGKATVLSTPVTEPAKGFVRVKVLAVALNPTDWKHVLWWKGKPGINTTVGCDYAGVIDKLGPGVGGDLKIGDRIAGFAYGSNANDTETGIFSEYANVDSGTCVKIPKAMSAEEASTIGVASITAGQTSYQNLGLPLPTKPATKPFPVLIYGGSTSVGNLAIQYAKLSGLTVVTLASKRNHDWLLSLGADAVFDYNDADVAKKVRECTDNKLEFALDTISEEGSATIVDGCISSNGGKVAQILEVDASKHRKDIQYFLTLAYTAFGNDFKFLGAFDFKAPPADREFAISFFKITENLLSEGKIKPHKVKLMQGGLSAIDKGLNLLQDGKVSGEKLVYRIVEEH
ncbi:hypothetical protein B7463_g5208, partial [Scytalidium lignicola]